MTLPWGSGVYFDKNKQLYHARIYRKGRNFHIGRYPTIEEAISERNKYKEMLDANNQTSKQSAILQTR